MTITTLDGIANALGNNSSGFVIDKASIGNATAGQYFSLWRATGQPGQGAIPAGAATCNHTLTGAIGFAQQTAPATSYGGFANALCSNSATAIEVHDRLMHMGGLNGTLTTAQTVGIDFNGVTADNMVARIGNADYSNIQWWLEWYTDTGSTAATATVAVTYNDGTTGNLTGVSLAATRRASFMQPLNGLIPSASSGKSIRAVNSVTLSASTGTAGNFGVTATRLRILMPTALSLKMEVFDWAALGFPEIFNSSCLSLVTLCSAASTGTVRGSGKIAHG